MDAAAGPRRMRGGGVLCADRQRARVGSQLACATCTAHRSHHGGYKADPFAILPLLPRPSAHIGLGGEDWDGATVGRHGCELGLLQQNCVQI